MTKLQGYPLIDIEWRDTMTEVESRYAPRMFGGDYEPEDEPKMITDFTKVRDFFFNNPNRWYTKEEVRIGAGMKLGQDASPRIRDMRKKRHGFWEIRREKIGRHYCYMFTGEHRTDE